jgi:ribosomal protein S18 acetylase RimI-like enzyme
MPPTHTPSRSEITIRPATPDDSNFILSLVPRFVEFDLPKGRRKRECAAAIRADIERALQAPSGEEVFFISEGDSGERSGFLHLQVMRDFFAGTRNCHISDLAVATGHDGNGIGRTLLEYAHAWAAAHRCERLTLAVFPGNARARALYERAGFDVELLRMTRPLG